MGKSGAGPSPVVPGKYLVFVERLVQEHYQTLEVDADNEDEAREKALALFFAGSLAYVSSTQVEAASARVRPMREKNLRKTTPTARGQGDDSDFRTSGRFDGPDDEMLRPTSPFPGTRPSALTRAQARLMCQNFDASGHSNHSGQGSTLWVILEHCAEVDIAYNLRALPGVGYYVERAKQADDGLALRMSVETGHGPLRP